MTQKCSCSSQLYQDSTTVCPQCGRPLFRYDPYADHLDTKKNAQGTKFRQIAFLDEEDENTEPEASFAHSDDNPPSAQTKTSPTTPSSTAGNGRRQDYLEGIVRNFREDVMPGNFFEKWLRSLILGVPLTLSDTINHFQLIHNEWELDPKKTLKCEEVIIYGKFSRGKPMEDNRVRIWGKRDRFGAINVSKMYNLSSQTWLRIDHSYGAATIWAVTVGTLAVLVRLVIMLIFIPWGEVLALGLQALLYIVLGWLALRFIFTRIRRFLG